MSVLNSIYTNDSLASFGFIGAQTKKKRKRTLAEKKMSEYKGRHYTIETTEAEQNTKRYRIYRKIVDTFIDPTLFKIQQNEAKSMYLLLNNDHQQQQPELLENICNMIDECYLTNEGCAPLNTTPNTQ